MSTIRMPALLRSYTGGLRDVPVQGASVAEVMQHLVEQYPTPKTHLYMPDGQMRLFVNLFLNDENIKNLEGLDTPVQENDLIRLVPNIAGGSE
jgi:molybdopterin converting factor small subunit